MALYKRKEFFVDKMMGLYEYTKDTLNDIISNRTIYESDALNYPKEMELLKMYNLYESVKTSDIEISNELLVTCYWFVYMNFQSETPTFIETDEKGNEKLLLNNLADYLIKQFCVITADNMIYVYVDDCYYNNPKRLEKSIVKILKNNGYSDIRKIEPIVRDIIYRIKHETTKYKSSPFNKKSTYLIPVANGVVVRKNLNLLLPKSPVWGFTYGLPTIYDATADPEPIKKFINDVVDGEDRDLLIQIPAQALMQNSNYQLSYLLTGDGSNGKSTYIKILNSLVGKESYTAVSLQELVNNRFAAAELHGKLFNLYADLSKESLKSTGIIKLLTGGDVISAEKKFQSKFTFENKAVFVFSANELPQIDDGTYAFWRRWAVIEFPHKFKVSPGFIENLITPKNLSGFLNLIIERMNTIDSNQGLHRTSKVEEIMEMWHMRSNSAYAFIKTRLEKSPNKYVSKSILWHEYNQYCIDNEFTEVSKIKFREQLAKSFAIEDTYIVESQKRVQVIKGITFRDLSSPQKTEVKEERIDTSVETKIT